MTERGFRLILLAHIATALAAGAIGALVPDLLPLGLQREYELAEAAAFQNVWTWPVIVLSSIAGFASYVGLYLLKAWGRLLALLVTLATFVLYPLFGPVITSWPEAALVDLSSILGGAVLALAYFGPVAARFGANSSSKPTPLRGAA